jgi:hypothetical protein
MLCRCETVQTSTHKLTNVQLPESTLKLKQTDIQIKERDDSDVAININYGGASSSSWSNSNPKRAWTSQELEGPQR